MPVEVRFHRLARSPDYETDVALFLPSRYLRAAKWDVAKAIERLESTLKWRRSYGVYTHTPEYLEPEVHIPPPPLSLHGL